MTRVSWRILVVVVAGVAIFAGFSVYADVRVLGERLSTFSWWAFGAALALAVCNYALRFIRWQLYLRHRSLELPTRLSLQVFLAGFALSITPGKLGELIKSFVLREARGIPIAQSAPIVVAERVTDLAALLILGGVGVVLYGVAATTVIVGICVVGAGLFTLSYPPLARALIHALTAPRLTARFQERLLEFYDGLAALVRPGPMTWATALAAAAWLAECAGFALIPSAFPGTQVPVSLAILIYATTTIAGALSFLPGGLLVTEATMTLMLVQASRGVDEPTAVAATILTRLATLWFAVAIGIIALTALRRSLPSAVEALADRDPDTEEAATEA